ncbi:MAG: hypothetical protein WAU78_00885 [Roseiarcus sp.]
MSRPRELLIRFTPDEGALCVTVSAPDGSPALLGEWELFAIAWVGLHNIDAFNRQRAPTRLRRACGACLRLLAEEGPAVETLCEGRRPC